MGSKGVSPQALPGFIHKVAVITGAGSGIGRSLAIELARAGAKVAISDIDAEGLAETSLQAKAFGGEVHAEQLNVVDREAVLVYADAIKKYFGKVNQVYNNAGITHHAEVGDCQFKDFERVIDVDFWGVVNGTKAFLPHLIESGDGHVINVSSLFGLLSVSGQSAYNAAKFAVRGFTESLRLEMIAAKMPVAVTCVHPGGIKTAFVRNATVAQGYDKQAMVKLFDKYMARTRPQTAARTILNAVALQQPRVLVGADATILDMLVRLIGPGYQGAFVPIMRFSSAGISKPANQLARNRSR